MPQCVIIHCNHTNYISLEPCCLTPGDGPLNSLHCTVLLFRELRSFGIWEPNTCRHTVVTRTPVCLALSLSRWLCRSRSHATLLLLTLPCLVPLVKVGAVAAGPACRGQIYMWSKRRGERTSDCRGHKRHLLRNGRRLVVRLAVEFLTAFQVASRSRRRGGVVGVPACRGLMVSTLSLALGRRRLQGEDPALGATFNVASVMKTSCLVSHSTEMVW